MIDASASASRHAAQIPAADRSTSILVGLELALYEALFRLTNDKLLVNTQDSYNPCLLFAKQRLAAFPGSGYVLLE